jgi:hypothetical protein
MDFCKPLRAAGDSDRFGDTPEHDRACSNISLEVDRQGSPVVIIVLSIRDPVTRKQGRERENAQLRESRRSQAGDNAQMREQGGLQGQGDAQIYARRKEKRHAHPSVHYIDSVAARRTPDVAVQHGLGVLPERRAQLGALDRAHLAPLRPPLKGTGLRGDSKFLCEFSNLLGMLQASGSEQAVTIAGK